MKNHSKVRKIGNLALQILIIAGTYGFIYKQVFLKGDFPKIINTLKEDFSQTGFASGLVVVLLLMFVNWGLESSKWKFLISKVERVSFLKSVQAVLAGICISSFTPNRVGEFFGRVFMLRMRSRIEGILITIIGSMGQLLITVLAGSIAWLIFIPQYFPASPFASGYFYYAQISLVFVLDLLLLMLFFNVSFLTSLKERILKNGLKKLRRFFRVFTFYHNKEIATVLLFSFLRYLVFSTQFYLLLRLFSVPVDFFDAQILIAIIYFIMAVIPTIALTELGIRGSVSIYIFGLYVAHTNIVSNNYDLGVLAATTLLWVINLGIPAVLGSVFIFRLQFFRK
ncbi:MAG: lysylphosphatidylglycerol synthase domain-containing protein [Bacteroidales bacterium]|nr:lysylphosphatidylglycerol synthase domain-containing protein [Bacteroidales bacterium]